MNRKMSIVLVGTAAAALIGIPVASALASTTDNPEPTAPTAPLIAPQTGVLSDSLDNATTIHTELYCEPGASGSTCDPVG